MGNEKHFFKKDIQTHLKHILLREYLKNWGTVFYNASIRKHIKKVHFVDGFAGKGNFDDGQDGSPLIAVNNLFELQRKIYEYDNRLKFIIHTVELNKEYHDALINLRKSAQYPSQINNYHGEFETHVPTLLKSTNGAPALYFIDPFGYKGVNMNDIQRILKYRSHEVLINVMSYSLVRNSRIIHNQEPLYRFFGVKDLPSTLSDYLKNVTSDLFENVPNKDYLLKLEDKIIEFYMNQLRNNSSEKIYTLSKRISSKINPNIYFHLVFATKSRDGLVEMKKAMVTFEKIKDSIEKEYAHQNNLDFNYIDDLFSDSVYYGNCDYVNFVKKFLDLFNNKKITYGDVVDHYLQYSPLPFEDKEKNVSIYDFSRKLFKHKLIYTSRKNFSDYKKANDLVIYAQLPSNFLETVQESTKNYNQMSLF